MHKGGCPTGFVDLIMDYSEFLDSQKSEHLERLKDFVTIASVSTDDAYRPQMKQAAGFVMERCRAAGLEPRLVETARHPAVLARGPECPGKPTVLIYGHYDVQPAEDVELWQSDPFQPEVRDHRMYGRGASDNKGQILAHLNALEALTNCGGIPVNVVVLVEGEEEIGSPNLPALLTAEKEYLKADVAVVSDTSTAVKGYPTIHYSLRGIVIGEVRLRCAARDIHSGVYGGTTENAVRALVQLCARLHDAEQRVTIPGFYDDVLPIQEWEKEHLQRLPFDEKTYLEWIGASQPLGEGGYSTNERRWFRPTLEFNGIYGGYQGQGSKTIVPAQSGVKLSARLVPHQRPEKVMGLLKDWFESQSIAGVELEFCPADEGPPYLFDPRQDKAGFLPAAQQAIVKAFEQEPLLCRHGGAIPIVSRFEDLLQVKTLLMGLGSPDDAIHSYNEKFELDNYFRGMKMSAAFLESVGKL